MEQQTAALIQQLAAKLGTTAEYLWAVLVKQAPISGAIDVLQYIILAAFVWLYVRWLRSEHNPANEEAVMFGAFGGGFVLCVLMIVAFCSISDTLTAFINPEYWALEKVIAAAKSK